MMHLFILSLTLLLVQSAPPDEFYHSKLRLLGSENKTENEAGVPEKLTKPIILGKNPAPPLLYTYKLLPSPHHLQQLNFYGYQNQHQVDRQYQSTRIQQVRSLSLKNAY